jgi:hypothetical protein
LLTLSGHARPLQKRRRQLSVVSNTVAAKAARYVDIFKRFAGD